MFLTRIIHPVARKAIWRRPAPGWPRWRGVSLHEGVTIDTTDGLRITFERGEIAHLRPSGNAPELRAYTEADSPERAAEMNRICMQILAGWR